MQSLHILRCALRGSLLPIHLEHRQAARSVRRNKIVLQCEASTLRGKHSVSNGCTPLRFSTHSFNGWRCCPIPPLYKVLLGRAFSLRSPLRARELLSSPSFPHQGALALFACGRADFSPMEHVGKHYSLRPTRRTSARQYEQ